MASGSSTFDDWDGEDATIVTVEKHRYYDLRSSSKSAYGR